MCIGCALDVQCMYRKEGRNGAEEAQEVYINGPAETALSGKLQVMKVNINDIEIIFRLQSASCQPMLPGSLTGI
jgi:hypothetical protein